MSARTGLMRQQARRRRISLLTWMSTALFVAAVAILSGQSYQLSEEDPSALNGPYFWSDGPGKYFFVGSHSRLWLWIVVMLGLGAACLYAFPRRRRTRSTWILLAAWTSFTAMILALATYLPCSPQGSSVAALPAWILEIFVGAYEFDGPGKVCALHFSPGFILARSLGIMFTVAAGAGVSLGLARGRLERLFVRWSDNVDVVVGLNDDSIVLVRALLNENARRTNSDEWIQRLPHWRNLYKKEVRPRLTVTERKDAGSGWHWLTGRRVGDQRPAGRRRTVVVDNNEANPLLGEARLAGAIVLVADPTNPDVLASVTVKEAVGRRRLGFHRLYAVSIDQAVNLLVESHLGDLLDQQDVGDRPDQAVPRLFVRLDDERRAQMWRISQTQTLGVRRFDSATPPRLIRDAITVDGLAAAAIVEQLISPGQWMPGEDSVTHVALVGDSSLSLACLDELAWQLWTRLEVAIRSDEENHTENAALQRTSSIVEVALFGKTAPERAHEWEELSGRWEADAGGLALTLFRVITHEGVEDAALRRYLENPQARVVFLDATPDSDSMASRLARSEELRRHNASRVIAVRPDAARGGTVVPGDASRIAKALVAQNGRLDEPPTDSITRHARQQHRAFLATWDETPMTTPTDSRLTRVPWPQLPNFFQEDNVRQYWQILSWFGRNGYRWEWTDSSEEVARVVCDLPVLRQVAADEYARWQSTRVAGGWLAGQRHDRYRIYPNLTDAWEELDAASQEHNIDLTRMVIRRMAATGLVPVKVDQPMSR